MDPTTDAVQPDEGQGGAGESAAPYAQWLDRIPEEVRGEVEPVFKDWDANVTRRFQEASEYRNSWKPYEELGVNQLTPDEVQWALQFRQAAAENPQAVKEWYQQYAKAYELNDPAPEPAAPAAPQEDPYGFNDPTADVVKKQLEQHLAPFQQQLEQISQWREQQEYQQRLADAQRMVRSQMDELREKHPDEFNEQYVEKLVAQYIDTDPQHAVQRAFADWQTIRSQIEKGVLESKLAAPAPAESGGAVNSAPEPIRTLDDANRIALERLRGARQA